MILDKELPTAFVDLTVDEYAIVIASQNEARKGIEQIIERRISGENVPRSESEPQIFNSLASANAKMLARLRDMRAQEEVSHAIVELTADELSASIAATATTEKRCLKLVEEHNAKGDLRKVEHGLALSEYLNSALQKMQFAFQNMTKVNNE